MFISHEILKAVAIQSVFLVEEKIIEEPLLLFIWCSNGAKADNVSDAGTFGFVTLRTNRQEGEWRSCSDLKNSTYVQSQILTLLLNFKFFLLNDKKKWWINQT